MRPAKPGKSVQWTDLSIERRELGRAATSRIVASVCRIRPRRVSNRAAAKQVFIPGRAIRMDLSRLAPIATRLEPMLSSRS